ncbi:MAG TPA: tetratricopeptide repeat protein, partial [Labilithrix sp.]
MSQDAPEQQQAPAVAAAPNVRRSFVATLRSWAHDYFMGDEPTLGIAYVPFGFLAIALFTRSPKTNFIFDEQEALLANPYVRSASDPHPKFGWLDAFYRDFWGLGPERSIGSYRPIPNLIWRVLWKLGARDTPFFHHWVNVYLHALNGAILCVIAYKLTRNKTTAWIAGAAFTSCAVLTEAVSGVVGIADVLGATGAMLAILSLVIRRTWVMGIAMFVATLFGLYSKESALCCVPLVPVTALLCAQLVHPVKPQRWLRAAIAFVACGAAFVLYVELRRRMFPAPVPEVLSVAANADKPPLARAFAAMLRWYAQPSLPQDPLNNPLVNTHGAIRVSGALRVYWRGLVQLVWPYPLSGDYSAPQEPAPEHPIFLESILGALMMIAPFVLAAWLGIRAYRRSLEKPAVMPIESPYRDMPQTAAKPLDVTPVIGAGALWIMVSYFPVSNIPALLPTIRAERFWYFPAIGSSLILAIGFTKLIEAGTDPRVRRLATVLVLLLIGAILVGPIRDLDVGHGVVAVIVKAIACVLALGAAGLSLWWFFVDRARNGARMAVVATSAFLLFQCSAARRHANDYTDDLVFWDATRHAVPRSAKAHLNYSVMKGARGDLQARLESNEVALELAPKWPMASIYLGD